MYYNLPGASGVTLDAAQLGELRRGARVTSLKDTGGDAVAATELVHAGEDAPTRAPLLALDDCATFQLARHLERAQRSDTVSVSPAR